MANHIHTYASHQKVKKKKKFVLLRCSSSVQEEQKLDLSYFWTHNGFTKWRLAAIYLTFLQCSVAAVVVSLFPFDQWKDEENKKKKMKCLNHFFSFCPFLIRFIGFVKLLCSYRVAGGSWSHYIYKFWLTTQSSIEKIEWAMWNWSRQGGGGGGELVKEEKMSEKRKV